MAGLAFGTKFRKARINIAPQVFAAGQTTASEIPKGLLHKQLVIRLTGSLVVGVANAAAIFAEAPLGLMRTIQIVADGNKVLWTANGRQLYRLAHYMRGKQGERVAPVVGVGTNAFRTTVTMDLEAVRFISPNDSYFDPRLYEKVEIKVSWGQPTDIATAGGGGGTLAISATTQAVFQSVQTAVGVERIIFDKIVTTIQVPITATNPQLAIPLPRAGILAHVLLCSDRDPGDGTGPAPVDNIVNSVTFRTENTVRHFDSQDWATLQRDNVTAWQLDGATVNGDQIPGYALVDLTEDGLLSTAINVNSLNACDLVLDVSAAGGGTQTVFLVLVYFLPRSLPTAHAA